MLKHGDSSTLDTMLKVPLQSLSSFSPPSVTATAVALPYSVETVTLFCGALPYSSTSKLTCRRRRTVLSEC